MRRSWVLATGGAAARTGPLVVGLHHRTGLAHGGAAIGDVPRSSAPRPGDEVGGIFGCSRNDSGSPAGPACADRSRPPPPPWIEELQTTDTCVTGSQPLALCPDAVKVR
jgi:hypothetical protein